MHAKHNKLAFKLKRKHLHTRSVRFNHSNDCDAMPFSIHSKLVVWFCLFTFRFAHFFSYAHLKGYLLGIWADVFLHSLYLASRFLLLAAAAVANECWLYSLLCVLTFSYSLISHLQSREPRIYQMKNVRISMKVLWIFHAVPFSAFAPMKMANSTESTQLFPP